MTQGQQQFLLSKLETLTINYENNTPPKLQRSLCLQNINSEKTVIGASLVEVQ